MKKTLTILTLLLSLPFTLHAKVYKSVDEDGNIIYTDIPPEQDSEEISLPKINVSIPVKIPTVKPLSKKEKTQSTKYDSLQIIQPDNNSTIRANQQPITILVKVQPAIMTNKGHELFIMFDGIQVNHESGTSATIQNPDRGSHQIQALVKNKDHQTITQTAPVTVHVKQPANGQ